MKKIRLLRLATLYLAVVFIVLLCIGFLAQQTSVFASAMSVYLKDILNSENASEYIDESSVIITLTKEATQKYKTYSEHDFKEIDCLKIENLTQSIDGYVKKINSGVFNGRGVLIETDNYKQMLKLDLKNVGVKHVAQAIEKLNKRDDVLVAGPNYIHKVEAIPTDSFYENENMWGLRGDYGINAESAWDISTGSNTTIVGVIDSGIQADHPDLVNRISTGGLHRDFTVDPEIEVSNANLVDHDGHGTHVAGIIGAQGNNSIGISGVCWNVSLVSLRIFDENGNGSSASLARAISYAASQNIPILNYSGGSYIYDINVHSALANYSGLFVCSAGNGGQDKIGDDNDSIPIYPSNFSNDQYCRDRVISVGAINRIGRRAGFSNYGANSVSLFAPGYEILSTYPQQLCTGIKRETRWGEYLDCECVWTNLNNPDGEWEWVPTKTQHYEDGYHCMSGTSMAAPHVTGVAALLLAKYPSMTAADIKYTIMQNVGNSFSITNYCASGGILNAYNAMSNAHYSHSYTNFYRYTDGKWHKAYCKCGAVTSKPHVIKDEWNSQVKTCILCHGRVEIGMTPYPNSADVLLMSANGSYILPNGIVVLVDLDIESYMCGTLKFYDKNTIKQ